VRAEASLQARDPSDDSLVVTGVALALVPGLPTVQLAPELVLLLVLPPIVYSSAVAMSWREFRFNLRAISLLAIGCVAFTTIAVAAAVHWILGLSWPVGFVLVRSFRLRTLWRPCRSPPAAVALDEFWGPRREGLANDATALILYRFAIAAVSAGVFSLGKAAGIFAAIVAGEIVWESAWAP